MMNKANVVGFYRKNGVTHPITKSEVELLRKKVIRKPRQFRSIRPKMAKGGLARVWDLSAKETEIEAQLEAPRIGRDELSYQGDDVSTVTLQLKEKISNLAKVKKAIRKLRRKKGVVKTW